ncbi:MAG: hypothetical protein HQK79_14195 [Desulfobacterales bacterium]|nr:hypothetical protein [Desulfobacterales bacterium]
MEQEEKEEIKEETVEETAQTEEQEEQPKAEEEEQEEHVEESTQEEEEQEEDIKQDTTTSHNKKPAKERISQLYGQMKAAQREVEYWKTKALGAKEEPKAKTDTEKEPHIDEYKDYDEYIKAISSYHAKKAINEARQKEIEHKTKSQQEQELESFREKLNRGVTKYDDYEEIIYSPKTIISQGVVDAIRDSDIPDEIVYYLGKNPKESERISKLQTISSIAREIGKIEAKIMTKPNAEYQKTKAPSTVKTVGSKEKGSTKKIEEMSMEEYYEHVKKRDYNKIQ